MSALVSVILKSEYTHSCLIYAFLSKVAHIAKSLQLANFPTPPSNAMKCLPIWDAADTLGSGPEIHGEKKREFDAGLLIVMVHLKRIECQRYFHEQIIASGLVCSQSNSVNPSIPNPTSLPSWRILPFPSDDKRRTVGTWLHRDVPLLLLVAPFLPPHPEV